MPESKTTTPFSFKTKAACGFISGLWILFSFDYFLSLAVIPVNQSLLRALSLSAYAFATGLIFYVFAGKSLRKFFWGRNEAFFIEERYKALFDRSFDCIYLHDLKGNFIDANQAAVELTGYTQKELHVLNIAAIIDGDRLPGVYQHLDEMSQKGVDDRLWELKIRNKEGEEKVIELRLSLIFHNDKPIAFQGIARDITHRKQVEYERIKRKEFIETILENLPIGLAVHKVHRTEEIRNNRFLYMNKKFQQIYGWGKEEMEDIDVFFSSLYPDPDYRKRVREMVAAGILTGDPDKMVWENVNVITREGLNKFITAINIPLWQQDLMISTVQDVTHRHMAEKALKESEYRYRTILDSIDAAYYELDFSGNLIFSNDAFAKITGYSQKDLTLFAGPERMETITAGKISSLLDSLLHARTPVRQYEHEITTKNGQKIFMESAISLINGTDNDVIGIRGIMRDISQRKYMDEKLRQSQKMEAVGALAGGIAHDFNNLLSAILGYTELAISRVNKEEKIHSYLQGISKAGKRGAELTQQILAFSRQTEQESRPISVKSVIREALKLLRPSIPSHIRIREKIDSDAHVMADSTQIHQVIMNLCTNAVHAMENDGGVLEIKLEDVLSDNLPGPVHPEDASVNLIKLTVKDTGQGMTKQVMDSIFNPYFTTKEKGKGSGLGLSITHGIIKKFGGDIQVLSEYAKGSEFIVLLPAIEPGTEGEVEAEEILPTGHERILLVDDEPSIVDMTSEQLQSLGYRVETRISSPEALALFKQNPDRFDLVITDLTMPVITGDKLSMDLIRIRPDIPVVLCTGYGFLDIQEKAKRSGIKAILLKPILKSEMAGTVRNLLDANSAA